MSSRERRAADGAPSEAPAMQLIREYVRRLIGAPTDRPVAPLQSSRAPFQPFQRPPQRVAFKRARNWLGLDDDEDDDRGADEPPTAKRYRAVRSHFPKIMPKQTEDDWTAPRSVGEPKVRYVPVVKDDSFASLPAGHSSPLLFDRKWSSPMSAGSVSPIGPGPSRRRPSHPKTYQVINLDDDDEDDEEPKFVRVVNPPRSGPFKSRDEAEKTDEVLYVKTIDAKETPDYYIRRPNPWQGMNRFFKSRNPKFPLCHSQPKTLASTTCITKPKSNVISSSFRMKDKFMFQELIKRTKLASKRPERNIPSGPFSGVPKLDRPASGFVDLTDELARTDRPSKATLGQNGSTLNSEGDQTKKQMKLDEIEKSIIGDEEYKPPAPKVSHLKVENQLELFLRHKNVMDSGWIDSIDKKYRELSLHKEAQVEKIEEGVEIVEELPELTDKQEAKIDAALRPHPQDEVLIDKFSLRIHRRDIATLSGLSWLNDEVINFYMNLLMERSKQNDKLPKVYCTNTFFLPRLHQAGHAGLKRWTRKVDIFAHDLMMVPVHLGVHWCMSIIDFRKKHIGYYDSMGGKNRECCSALLKYLEDEMKDKKGQVLDTSKWSTECIKDIPQQMNGSDCGMFSCMFAEYVSRNAPISFTQTDMPYFRRKMILEIIEGQLIV